MSRSTPSRADEQARPFAKTVFVFATTAITRHGLLETSFADYAQATADAGQ
jgi:hypothetical protein